MEKDTPGPKGPVVPFWHLALQKAFGHFRRPGRVRAGEAEGTGGQDTLHSHRWAPTGYKILSK